MKSISSESNPLFKLVTKLKTKQQRSQKRMFLVFDKYSVDCAVEKGLVKYFFTNKEEFISESVLSLGVKSIVLSQKLWKKVLTIYKQSSCRQFVVCQFFQHSVFFSLPEKVKSETLQSKIIFFYEEVQNYYNLGMILRICLAFKIRNIFLSKNSVDVYHPLVVSASRGAVFDVCVFSADFKEVEPLFKTSSYEVITTVACEKQNFTLKNFPFLKQEKYVIIFGNEGHGLVANKHLMKVRKTISIPTEGTMKSLNLAVSSAIIAYELSSFFNK